MGRIKDLIIELQNEYGYELENLPEGFSMDEYLEMKSRETKLSEPLFCEQIKNRK